MRVAGITLLKDKHVEIALTGIFGIGRHRASRILAAAEVSPVKKVKDLTREDEDRIREMVEKEYKTEGELRREISGNIKRLKDNKSYRGVRHTKGLPVRGQRTKTNNRTRRGNKRNLAPSGKKASAQKT